MRLNTLKPEGGRKARKRVGRGIAAGRGKTCGRGQKGQHARSGGFHKVGFEGGQMPLQRRVPKRGFKNVNRKEYQVVNLADLARFDAAEIDLEALRKSGLARRKTLPVKLLANGKIDRAVKISVHACSKTAKDMVEKAGGEVQLIKA